MNADNTPVDNTPVDNTPVDNTPVDNNEHKVQDDRKVSDDHKELNEHKVPDDHKELSEQLSEPLRDAVEQSAQQPREPVDDINGMSFFGGIADYDAQRGIFRVDISNFAGFHRLADERPELLEDMMVALQFAQFIRDRSNVLDHGYSTIKVADITTYERNDNCGICQDHMDYTDDDTKSTDDSSTAESSDSTDDTTESTDDTTESTDDTTESTDDTNSSDDSIEDKSNLCRINACGHLFHERCFMNMLNYSARTLRCNRCPLCRVNIA